MAFGVGAFGLLELRAGAGSDAIGWTILIGSLSLGAAMGFTHWLCKRNRWR